MAEQKETSGAETNDQQTSENLAEQEPLQAVSTPPSRQAGANQPQHLLDDESLQIVDDQELIVKSESQ